MGNRMKPFNLIDDLLSIDQEIIGSMIKIFCHAFDPSSGVRGHNNYDMIIYSADLDVDAIRCINYGSQGSLRYVPSVSEPDVR